MTYGRYFLLFTECVRFKAIYIILVELDQYCLRQKAKNPVLGNILYDSW